MILDISTDKLLKYKPALSVYQNFCRHWQYLTLKFARTDYKPAYLFRHDDPGYLYQWISGVLTTSISDLNPWIKTILDICNIGNQGLQGKRK